MNTQELVSELKEQGQDLEFYPTTNEIIQVLIKHAELNALYGHHSYAESVLDIGAGHGKVLQAFKKARGKLDLLAIEKAPVLIRELVKIATVVGTDFHEQSLQDSTPGIVFCNPPYKEYEQWSARIIREFVSSDIHAIYLVIPQRWVNSKSILDALELRKAEHKVIGSFDFLDSEDRKARAKVDLLYIKPKVCDDEMFSAFFEEQFGDTKQAFKEASAEQSRQRERTYKEVVQKQGLVGALVELYNEEMERLRVGFNAATQLDPEVLIELDLTPDAIIEKFRNKLQSLKKYYWQELFKNMEEINKRLTKKNARSMLERINRFHGIDFTKSNIYAVLAWILEKANEYTDSQIVDVFKTLAMNANVVNYKSNKKVFTDNQWRYCNYGEAESRPTHYKLDYRIVVARFGLYAGWTDDYRLCDSGHTLLCDMLTIANLLHFDVECGDERLYKSLKKGRETFDWESRKPHVFVARDGTIIMEAKAFKNGNMHIRLGQKFALALNVAVGKLNGWLHSAESAAEELDDPEAASYFKQHLRLGADTLTAIGYKD